MLRKVRRGSAPRFAAASSRLRSIVRSDALTATTTKGSASAVWASTSPASEPAKPPLHEQPEHADGDHDDRHDQR